MKLYEIATQFRDVELLAGSDDVPAEVLRDTLDSIECDFKEKAVQVGFFCENLRATATEILARAAAMEERAKRLLQRADSLQSYLQFQMEATGITKIESPYFTLAIKKNPPTVVIDHEASIPAEFWQHKPAPPPTIDRRAIAAAIKAGQDVPGAHTESYERLELKL